MNQEQIKELLELIGKSHITIMGDIVFEKHNEQGSVGYDLRGSMSKPPKQSESVPVKDIKPEKVLKPAETMTFKRMGNVLEGHITLLFNKLVKEGWIGGNEADFKALFSGKRDENCMLTWVGLYGKSTLVELFRQFIKAGLVVLKEGYTLSEEEVNTFCLELPRYKRPRRVIFADIPRNPTGKIEKPVLRKQYCGESVVAQQNEINLK